MSIEQHARIQRNLTSEEKKFLKYNADFACRPANKEIGAIFYFFSDSTRLGAILSSIKREVGWLRYVDLLYLCGGEVGIARDYENPMGYVHTCLINPAIVAHTSSLWWSTYAINFYQRHYLDLPEDQRPPLHVLKVYLFCCHPFFYWRQRYFALALKENGETDEPFPLDRNVIPVGKWVQLLPYTRLPKNNGDWLEEDEEGLVLNQIDLEEMVETIKKEEAKHENGQKIEYVEWYIEQPDL